MNIKLKLHPLEAVDQLVYPEKSTILTMESPALSVVTDFAVHQPLVIEADTSLADAEQLMRKSHVRLKLVIESNGALLGLISTEQLYGEMPLQLVKQGYRREDMTIADVMQKRGDIQTLDFNELEKSTIGDVLLCLQSEGLQHCLVVEHQAHQIRGVLSAAQIARRLHIDLPISSRATSFLEVFEALHHSEVAV